MPEIVKITLENEMDLILAHKRTMKLAEMCGLSVPAQTTFATAVSEIARTAISHGNRSYLTLSIELVRAGKKEIIAMVADQVDLKKVKADAYAYAERLIGDIKSSAEGGWYFIKLRYLIPYGGTISNSKIQGFQDHFKSEPPLSPYDEIRKKNIQLIELSEKLQANERLYSLLTDTLPLLMFSLNQKGEIVYANKGLKDHLHIQGLPAGNILWSTLFHAGDQAEHKQLWERSLANRVSFQSQGRLKAKDGHQWYLISIVPVKSEKDIVTGWIGFFADITDQKRAEETLKDNRELKEAQRSLQTSQKQLEQKITQLNLSNHSLEQFAYIASHDLQEPLRKIKTYTLLLEKKLQLDESQKHFFSKIVASSDKMSTLINDVLAYSRLSNPNENFEDVDLNMILESVLTDFDLKIQEKQAKVEVGPMPVLHGLPLQFVQLFSNLMSNALKFSGDGPVIKITSRLLTGAEVAEHAALDPDRPHYQIDFSDTGLGFEQKYAEQIFVIFQRLTESKQSGTGIGLALVKKIVDNHAGLISAKSEPGVGTTFCIILPGE